MPYVCAVELDGGGLPPAAGTSQRKGEDEATENCTAGVSINQVSQPGCGQNTTVVHSGHGMNTSCKKF